MAETAGDVVIPALQEILVQASEAPLEADEIQTGIKYLNNFMTALAAKGLNLGYTKVTSLSDSLTIPDGAIEGVIFNLAKRLAPQFGKVVSPDLRENAKDGMDAIRRIVVFVPSSKFPGTLSVGSGNEGDLSGSADHHFYPETAPQVLTEQNGPILLEDDT